MRMGLLGTVTLIGLLALACGSESTPTFTRTVAPTATIASSGPMATQPPAPLKMTADIKNFTHLDLTVQVGTEVTWLHGDGARHTTSSGRPGDAGDLWDSGTLRQGDTFAVTFDKAGGFPYYCKIHPSMQATVTVVESLGAQPSASSDNPVAKPTKAAGDTYDY